MNSRKLRWGRISTEEFVKLYLRQERLWNVNHEDYKCHWKRVEAYNEIINGMEKHVGIIDINDVRRKIKNLRCTYAQELAKIMNNSSDPDNVYEPRISWFPDMDKCLNSIILRKNITNYKTCSIDAWEGETEQIKDDSEPEDAFAESDIADEIITVVQNRKEPRSKKKNSKKIKNMQYRWGATGTEEFVRLYLRQEGLWNVTHEDYKCHRKRIASYKEIIDDMENYIPNMTVDDVRKKIKNLRCTYAQELNKIMNNSLDPDHIYEPTISWFADMDKCLNNIITRRNAAACKTSHVDAWGMETTHDDSDPLIGNDAFTESSVVEDDFADGDVIVVRNDNDEERSITFLKRKIEKYSDESTTSKTAKYDEDEFDLFGKHVASQLRKVDVRKALTLQTEIQNMLTCARLSDG